MSRRPRERGMVLVASLLMLVIVTILAVGLFRSFGIDEKIAGNTREKQRALQAAMSAQAYAEWWLSTGNGSSAITCGSTLVSYTVGQVCTNSLQSITNPATLATAAGTAGWATSGGAAVPGVTYAPPSMNVTQTIAAGTYWKTPVYYIAYLGTGLSPSGATGNVYQIDAVGYGGGPSTAAVVESTYIVVPHIASPRDGQ